MNTEINLTLVSLRTATFMETEQVHLSAGVTRIFKHVPVVAKNPQKSLHKEA